MQNLYLVYSSPYGHARRYAEWIAEELGCPCVDRRQADPAQAAASSALLLGGGLYAGGLSGIDFLRKNRDQLRGKPIYLFTCGLADPADPQNAAHIRQGVERALPEEMRGRAALFSFRGGIDYARRSGAGTPPASARRTATCWPPMARRWSSATARASRPLSRPCARTWGWARPGCAAGAAPGG